MKLGFSHQLFVKFSEIHFHKNPSDGSWADTCRQMDMTELMGPFHKNADVPKSVEF